MPKVRTESIRMLYLVIYFVRWWGACDGGAASPLVHIRGVQRASPPLAPKKVVRNTEWPNLLLMTPRKPRRLSVGYLLML
jgi:hypothetical protein